MHSRRTILIWLIITLAVGGAIDVFTYNERGEISIWRFLNAIPLLVLIWAWIRADRHRKKLPMYSRGFTWLLAFLAPVAFVYHAFNSRNPINAVVLILGAVGIGIAGSLAGGVLAILVAGFLDVDV